MTTPKVLLAAALLIALAGCGMLSSAPPPVVEPATGVSRSVVEDGYFGAKGNWDTVRDKAGAKLRFVEISNNEITCNPGCSYAEEFAAALPEAVLRANRQGLTVTFSAKSGTDKLLIVPGELIA